MLSKISHILPYLYYRSYRYYERSHKYGDSKSSARMVVYGVELMYLMVFVLIPLDILLFDASGGVFMLSLTKEYSRGIGFILLGPFAFLYYKMSNKRVYSYYDMMHLWGNESKSSRIIKWFILFLICIFPFVSMFPLLGALADFKSSGSHKQNKERVHSKIEHIYENKEKASGAESLKLEEIDDSQMWGIKKKEKEIRIVEEEN